MGSAKSFCALHHNPIQKRFYCSEIRCVLHEKKAWWQCQGKDIKNKRPFSSTYSVPFASESVEEGSISKRINGFVQMKKLDFKLNLESESGGCRFQTLLMLKNKLCWCCITSSYNLISEKSVLYIAFNFAKLLLHHALTHHSGS